MQGFRWKLDVVMLAGLLPAVLLGCSDNGGETVDAKPAGIDAPNGNGIAMELDCNGATIKSSVSAPGFVYAPPVSNLSVGEIVRFTMPANHDVNSNGQGFDVGFGATKCFKFLRAGNFGFKCTPHNFTGSIVVQ